MKPLSLRPAWLVYAAAPLGLALVLMAPCPPLTVLRVQKLLGIPGQEFRIGDAIVTTGADWLLESARLTAAAPARNYGFLPEWFTSARDNRPEGAYFVFRTVNGCSKGDLVGFEELTGSMKEETKAVLRRASPEEESGFERLTFQGWEALARRGQGKVVIGIPDLSLMIVAREMPVAEAVRFRRGD